MNKDLSAYPGGGKFGGKFRDSATWLAAHRLPCLDWNMQQVR